MPKILFTSANAAEMARRSHEARRQAEAGQQAAIAQATQIAELPADNFKDRALSRTREQLELVDRCLEECIEPKDWDALTRAKERLFRAWVHLAGIPGPGQRKPAPERQRPAKAQSPLAEE